MVTCNICKKNIQELEETLDCCELCDLKGLLYDGLCKECFICPACQNAYDDDNDTTSLVRSRP